MEAVGVMERPMVVPREAIVSPEKSKEKGWWQRIKGFLSFGRKREGLVEQSKPEAKKETPLDMSTKAILVRQDQRREQENLYSGKVSLATVDRLTHEGFSSFQEDEVGGSIEAQRRLDEQIKKKQESIRLQKVRKELVAQGA